MNTELISKTLHEMTELLDDWDDDGGKAIPQSLATCVGLFLYSMDKMAAAWGREAPDPTLTPGPDDTVDIHWDAGEFELLLNVKNETGLCGYYGERPEDSHVIRGHGYLSSVAASDFLRFIFNMPIDD